MVYESEDGELRGKELTIKEHATIAESCRFHYGLMQDCIKPEAVERLLDATFAYYDVPAFRGLFEAVKSSAGDPYKKVIFLLQFC